MSITNIVIAGLGGQGVITSANIIAQAAFLAGFDVKESEIHGMSQRGGSVSSDVRYGDKVFSPMISRAEADFILLLSDTEAERMLYYLKHTDTEQGQILKASDIDISQLSKPAMVNTVLLGILSKKTNIAKTYWQEAIKNNVPENYIDENLAAFELGIIND